MTIAARPSKKFPAVLARCFLLSLAALFALKEMSNAQLSSGSCGQYRGTLGGMHIGLSLYSNGTDFTGSYFYFRHLADIPLTGSYSGPRDITLVEKQPDGTPQGTFKLRFAEHDPRYSTSEPLQAEVLTGTWTGPDGKKSLPVSIEMQTSCPKPGDRWYRIAGSASDQAVEQNAGAFYHAVLSGNRGEAAKYVSFPCTYFLNGKRLSLKNSAAFLEQYDHIFSPEFVGKIAEDVPHHMFSNWQGIMIAGGAVWFDEHGKAKHLNNPK